MGLTLLSGPFCLSFEVYLSLLEMEEVCTITPDIFGAIYQKNRDKFVLIAQSYVREHSLAEDIVAEAFAKFWDRRADIRDTSLPEAYIMKMVKNMCLNRMRDRLTRMRLESEMNDSGVRALESELAFLSSEDLGFLFSSDVAEIFRNAMAEFPDLTRNIFYASRFDGMTYQEIARKYGISERKVKRDIMNVLASLRLALKDYLHFAVLVALLGL